MMSAVGSEEPEDAHFDPDAARTRWQRLDSETRRRILKAARQGRPIPEGQADSSALGWAWAVLGPPWSRRHPRWYDYAAMFFNNMGNRGFTFTELLIDTGGSADEDLVPIVRRTARNIEHVYLHARRPAAPYREPQPGENLKPEWLRRTLWGPGPRDADADQRAD
jgi:hypothetical protein